MHHDHHVEQLSMFELFSISVPPCEMGKWRIQPEQVEKKYLQAKKPNMHTWRSQKNLLEKQYLTHLPYPPFPSFF